MLIHESQASKFRAIAARRPKYLISMGRVTTPTIIKDDTKAAICIVPAPLLRSSAAAGKAPNPGMRAIPPTTEAARMPKNPDRSPITRETISGLKTARTAATASRTVTSCGSMLSKAFAPFRMARFAFSRSLAAETASKATAIAYRMIVSNAVLQGGCTGEGYHPMNLPSGVPPDSITRLPQDSARAGGAHRKWRALPAAVFRP